jgi:hypothetical protein
MRQLLKTTFTVFVALVFTAGMAFGQDSRSTIDQDGDDNAANIEQVGADHGSKVTQDTRGFGSGNEAVVRQNSGSGNYNELSQTVQATARIDQVGSDNTSLLSQGGQNSATVYQEGDGNRLARYGALGKKATQKNGTGAFANGANSLFLRQVGNDNTVGLLQEAGADAGITLNGDGNTVGVRQKGDYNSTRQTATVNVTGSQNTVDIFQGPRFGLGADGQTGTAIIDGSSNFVDFDQMAANSFSKATINGSNNSAVVVQK